MDIFFAVLAGAIVSGGVVWLAMTITRQTERITRQAERIKTLEDGQAKHLPYPTIEDIENAMAGLNYIEFDANLLKQRIDNIRAHLKKARNGKG